MMRTSTLIDLVPPTRRNSAVLEDAQQLGCVDGPISPISSREERALVGQLELPELARVGVGERALLVPKSSLSRSVSGMAAQLSVTSGRRARGLW